VSAIHWRLELRGVPHAAMLVTPLSDRPMMTPCSNGLPVEERLLAPRSFWPLSSSSHILDYSPFAILGTLTPTHSFVS